MPAKEAKNYEISGKFHSMELGSQKVFYARKGEPLKFFTVLKKAHSYRLDSYDAKAKEWRVLASGEVPANEDYFTYKWPLKAETSLKIRAVAIDKKSQQVFNSAPQLITTLRKAWKPPARLLTVMELLPRTRVINPGRWNPCARIPVKVDTAGVFRGTHEKAISDVKNALSYINKKAGMKFYYAGPTSHSNNVTDMPKKGVVIKWDGANRYASGGAVATVFTKNPRPNTNFYPIVQGKIVITSMHDNRDSYRAYVLRHEMMHILGAEHPTVGGQLTSAKRTAASHENMWGEVDQAYVKLLGRAAGCF